MTLLLKTSPSLDYLDSNLSSIYILAYQDLKMGLLLPAPTSSSTGFFPNEGVHSGFLFILRIKSSSILRTFSYVDWCFGRKYSATPQRVLLIWFPLFSGLSRPSLITLSDYEPFTLLALEFFLTRLEMVIYLVYCFSSREQGPGLSWLSFFFLEVERCLQW